MRVAIETLLSLSLVQLCIAARVAFETNLDHGLLGEDRSQNSSPLLPSKSRNDACTCCPVTPPVYNETVQIEVNAIKEQLKVDLDNLDKEFNTKRQELQDKIKKLEDEAAPLKEKLREVRKVNHDKEEELKIGEMTEKSRNLRKKFESLADNISHLSESRSHAKSQYRELKVSCRSSKSDEDFNEDDCKNQLSQRLEEIEAANVEVSKALKEIKQVDEEIVTVELQLKNAEEELWAGIFENREVIKDELEQLDTIYIRTVKLNDDLKSLGAKYVKDQKNLNVIANNKIEKIAPSKKFQWIDWNESRKNLPDDAVLGGEDVDGTKLYVIRRPKKDEVGYWYGKFAVRRGVAYIVKERNEYMVHDFQILTGDFVWCKKAELNYEYPICRAPYTSSLTPGEFLEDGFCRLGFAMEARKVKSNLEKLSLGECQK